MELNLEHPTDYPFVRKANAYTVIVADRPYTTSLIVTREKVAPDWPVTDVATMTPAQAEPILALKPDAVLLGTGARQVFPAQAVLAAFLQRGIGIEVMDNAAAARTWDIVAGEGRNVVAAFILAGGGGNQAAT